MDEVRPWIVKKVVEGPLQHVESSKTDPSLSALPLEPFRTSKIQFIRFLSPHRWGTHEPVWAEASDRDVTILVYISSEIMQKFESDQQADKRTFGELSYPTFFLGGCRWIWDAPANTSWNGKKLFEPQLCLKVVSDLPKKTFRIGSVVSCPAARLTSHTESKNPRDLYLLDFALRNLPESQLQWAFLVNKLRVTHDPRLLASGVPKESMPQNPADLDSLVHVSIPHPGKSRPSHAIKARRKKQQSKMPFKPSTTTSDSLQAIPSDATRNHEVTDATTDGSKKQRRLVSRNSVSKTAAAEQSIIDDDQETEISHEAGVMRSRVRMRAVNVAGENPLLRLGTTLPHIPEAGPATNDIRVSNVSLRDGSLGHPSDPPDRMPAEDANQDPEMMAFAVSKAGSLHPQTNSGLSDNLQDGRRGANVVNGITKGQSRRHSFNSRASNTSENRDGRGDVQMTDIADIPSVDSRKFTTPCTDRNVAQMAIHTSPGEVHDNSSREPTAGSSTSVQVGGVEAQQDTPRLPPSSTPVSSESPQERFLVYFSSHQYQHLVHDHIPPAFSRPLPSDKPFVLRIKGRKLAKYFA